MNVSWVGMVTIIGWINTVNGYIDVTNGAFIDPGHAFPFLFVPLQCDCSSGWGAVGGASWAHPP